MAGHRKVACHYLNQSYVAQIQPMRGRYVTHYIQVKKGNERSRWHRSFISKMLAFGVVGALQLLEPHLFGFFMGLSIFSVFNVTGCCILLTCQVHIKLTYQVHITCYVTVKHVKHLIDKLTVSIEVREKSVRIFFLEVRKKSGIFFLKNQSFNISVKITEGQKIFNEVRGKWIGLKHLSLTHWGRVTHMLRWNG